MTDRRLIVMRHAKAEPYAASDHARRLTDRGVADAAAAGAVLSERGLVPDHAVVSTSVRTRMTWDEVARETGAADVAELDGSLYAGGIDVVLAALRTVPESAGTVLLVGHNPTAAYLCHLLDDGNGDPEAVGGMLRGFPTSALVIFDVEVPWSDLGPETARVVGFHAPAR